VSLPIISATLSNVLLDELCMLVSAVIVVEPMIEQGKDLNVDFPRAIAAEICVYDIVPQSY
jgi:hypothetical protein